MGKTMVITVPGAVFSGPKFRVDPRLNDGSLILLDPAHSSGPWASGTALSAVPNVAKREAAALLGADTGTATLAVTDTISAATGAIERTAKGALHVAVKQSGTVSLEHWQAKMSSQILDYITANPTHGWYASAWGHATRARAIGAGPDNHPFAGLRRSNTATYTPWINFQFAKASGNITTSPGTSDAAYINRMIGSLSSGVGGFRVALGTSARTSTWGASVLSDKVAELGNVMAGSTDYAPSAVLYGLHIVDLTVAAAQWDLSLSQAYAKIDAIDAAQYTAALASGGRYHGDSWTAPATLAGA